MVSRDRPEGFSIALWELACRDWKTAVYEQAQALGQLKFRMQNLQSQHERYKKDVEDTARHLVELECEEQSILRSFQILCQMPHAGVQVQEYNNTDEQK
jgi:hypothetical protein